MRFVAARAITRGSIVDDEGVIDSETIAGRRVVLCRSDRGRMSLFVLANDDEFEAVPLEGWRVVAEVPA